MSFLQKSVMRRRAAAVVLMLLSMAAACGRTSAQTPAATTASASQQAAFERLSDSFLTWYLAATPLRATRLGIHEYDARMPQMSAAGMQQRASSLRTWLTRLESIDRERLGGDAYYDHRILDYAIRAELLELEEIREWRRNPAIYVNTLAGAISSLASRDFAPARERLANMISRFQQYPHVIAAARANLADVPELWATSAVGSARGLASYLRTDAVRALEAQGLAAVDPALLGRWHAARAAAIRDVEEFADWLEKDLVPRASGDFRLGRDLFERKVLYEEHVALTADELRAMNEAAIAEYKAWVAREAAAVDPRRPAVEVMDSITSLHPSAEELIPTARRMQEEIVAFIRARDIVTLPTDARPTIRETPEYARGGFASMDAPGPFETRATEAFYNITNVDPRWTAEQQRQHLTYFNYPGLLGITVHESFPGHFVQLLYRPQIPTDVRKVFSPGSLVEGWAHYAEQMMVDEGLGAGDPGVRLGQLRRALQRHARWYAGLEMHAFGETIENATRRYQEIAYFAPFPARREVERGTSDPTYLVYALGRMQILALREDYRRAVEARGETFSLREFHDRFLRLGLPIPLAREAMLGREHSVGTR